MDIIYLHGLRCEGRIGVHKWEKNTDQVLSIDLDLAIDASKAAQSDDLKDALDYQLVTQRVQSYVVENQFDLIETLAERLSAILLEDFAVSWLRIKVDKGAAVSGAKNVGIILERGDKGASI